MNEIDFKVSVRCMTYNQAEYIEDAMNGFCMQQTAFPFVCNVMDDASTDGEQDVIQNYLEAHFYLDDKSRFKKEETDDYRFVFARHRINKNCYFAVFYLKYNHYGSSELKNKKLTYYSMWESKVEYIAFCEGDDYWIDPLKLQKQVDFLNENNDYSACFGNRIVLYENKKVIEKRKYLKNDYSIKDIMSGTLMGLQNLCYRNAVSEIPCTTNSNGDFKISYQCAKYGNIRYLDEDFAIYRLSGKGLATSRNKEEEIEHSYKDWYMFHKEMGFQYNRELVKLDTFTFVLGGVIRGNLMIHIKYLNQYHSPSYMRYVWYVTSTAQYFYECFKRVLKEHKQVYELGTFNIICGKT